MHLVSIKALKEPRKEFLVRQVDDKHVEFLKTVLASDLKQHYMIMAVHAECNKQDFDVNEIDSFEVIGGNHTRCALQELVKDQSFIKGEECDMNVHVMVYCNLTTVEALTIGVKHNEERKNAKPETSVDAIKRFRRMLYLAGGSLQKENTCDPPSDTSSTKTWKMNVATVEGYQNVSIKFFVFNLPLLD